MPSPASTSVEQSTLDGRVHRPPPRGGLGPGTVVGRYVILELLGRGAMGVVYAAYDPELDRKIALKLLLRATHRVDEDGRQSLLREAQAMARLAHPNVVTVHDVGEHDRGVFVAMEFVAGSTLRQWLDHKTRTWREVLDVFIEAGQGLAAAHAAALVHRDFKPENVMVGDDGRIRVLDFGLVRPLAAQDPISATPGDAASEARNRPLVPDTEVGIMVGTPAYMSPEQMTDGQADERSDQFSFCVALYEALYGHRPFDGDSVAELVSNVLQDSVRAPPRRHDVPKWVQNVVMKGLQQEPSERHRSMTAVLLALRRDPSRVRRRWLAAGTVAAVAAGAIGVQQWLTMRARRGCERQAEVLRAEEWSDQRQQQLAVAITDQPFEFAAETWSRLHPRLDVYVDQWADASAAACTAHRLDGDWDAELALRADECLAERRAAFEVVAELVQTPSLEVLLQIDTAAMRLPSPSDCRDAGLLARQPAANADMRTQVLEVRTDLSRARMELEGGKLEASRSRLEAAIERAEDLDRHDLAARLQKLLGEVARNEGRYDEAAERLEQAYFGLGRVGDDNTQLNAAVSLVHIEAEYRGNLVPAELWLKHAQMLDDRASGPPGPASAVVLRALATVRLEQGKLDEALAAVQQAEQAAIQGRGSDHPSLEPIRSTMSLIEQMRGNYDLALAQTRARLERMQKVYGLEHPNVARALINVAKLEHQAGDPDGAHATAVRALELSERIFGPDHPRTAHALEALATVKTRRGQTDEAIALLERGVLIHERSGAGGADGITARLILGGMLVQNKQHARALEVLQTARKLLETRSEGTEEPLLKLLINLGAAHRGREELDEAATAYREALAVGESFLDRDHPMLAYPISNLGNVEFDRGNLEEARALQTRALEIRKAKLGPNHPLLAGTLQGLAKIDLAQDRPEDAIARLEEGIRILEDKDTFPERRAEMETLLEVIRSALAKRATQ